MKNAWCRRPRPTWWGLPILLSLPEGRARTLDLRLISQIAISSLNRDLWDAWVCRAAVHCGHSLRSGWRGLRWERQAGAPASMRSFGASAGGGRHHAWFFHLAPGFWMCRLLGRFYSMKNIGSLVTFGFRPSCYSMKTIAILCILAASLTGCSSSETTEVNHFTPDQAAARRTLTLRTSYWLNEGAHRAWAGFRDGDSTGFRHGVLITCNNNTIIDTRAISHQADTAMYIPFSPTFRWKYEDPDTAFEIELPAQPEPEIRGVESHYIDSVGHFSDPEHFIQEQLLLSEPFKVVYSPMGSCSNLQLIVGQDHTFLPKTTFNAQTGEILAVDTKESAVQPTRVMPPMVGYTYLAKVIQQSYHTSKIGTVLVKDSTLGQPFILRWK
jgi:hypothetical protein